MEKIVTLSDLQTITDTILTGKKVVVAGGCFDLLHIGHVRFLQKAKQQGDILIILLEHDLSVTKRKGPTRPIHTQNDRAEMLAALSVVDFIILLENNMTDRDYDRLVLQLKPAIIATTKDDPARVHKERQAAKSNAHVCDVIDRISNQSTSRLAAIVTKEFDL